MASWRFMRGLVCLLLSWSTLVAAQAPPRERAIAGFVRMVTGEWELEIGGRRERIAPGQALPVGAQVRLKDARRGSRIEIVRAHDVPFDACRHEKGQPLEVCEATFTLPETPSPLPFTARLLLIASRFFGSREGTYATPMVRGADPVLEDGIAVLVDNRIELSRVLRRVAAGKYRLRFTPLSEAGATRSEAFAVADWKPDNPAELPAPAGLRPGIYLLNVIELQESAWVLLAPQSDQQRLETSLAELESVTAQWPLETADKRGLRRALLEQLSREVVGRSQP